MSSSKSQGNFEDNLPIEDVKRNFAFLAFIPLLFFGGTLFGIPDFGLGHFISNPGLLLSFGLVGVVGSLMLMVGFGVLVGIVIKGNSSQRNEKEPEPKEGIISKLYSKRWVWLSILLVTTSITLSDFNTKRIIESPELSEPVIEFNYSVEYGKMDELRRRFIFDDDTSAFKKLVGFAKQGNPIAVEKLGDLADFYRDAMVKEILKTLSINEIVKSASCGNSYSVFALSYLAKFDNAAAKEALSTIDVSKFKAYATGGSQNAVYALKSLADSGNITAREVARRLEVKKFKESAIRGEWEPVYALQELVALGNSTALKVLIEIAAKGNTFAVSVLRAIADSDNHLALDALRTLRVGKFNKSAAKGNTEAIGALGELTGSGNTAALSLLVKLSTSGNMEAVRTLMTLVNSGNASAKGSIRTLDIRKFAKSASKGKADAIYILRDLYTTGNSASLEVLIKLVPKGNKDVINTLSNIAQAGDARVKAILKYLNVSQFKDAALKGNKDAFYSLLSLTTFYNASAFNALIDLATQGKSDAFEMFGTLIFMKHEGALDSLINLANRGYPDAVFTIEHMSFFERRGAKEALKTIGIAKFKETASKETGTKAANRAINALNTLEEAGNTNAFSALKDLVEEGNAYAFEIIKNSVNRRVLQLRQEHLERGLSGEPLKQRLAQVSLNNNPILLYESFISEENFGELAKMIFSELKSQAKAKDLDLHTYLKSLDPKKVHYRDFILKTANFNLLDGMLYKPAVFYEIMDEVFKELSAEEIKSWALRLALFLEDVVNDKTFPYQEKFQRYLRELYDKTNGLHKHFIAALLVNYKEQLIYLKQRDIAKIAENHHIRLRTNYIPYNELSNNFKITVHNVFSDKPAVEGYFKTTSVFLQNRGYNLVSKDNIKIVLEKEKILVVLIKADRQPYDIETYLGKAGVIVSRSHAGGERSVFKSQDSNRDETFIGIISSCRSATIIPKFRRYYPNANFIGTRDMTYGDQTNEVMYYLLEGLNKGIATYQELGMFIRKNLSNASKYNYILFADPSDRVSDEVIRYQD